MDDRQVPAGDEHRRPDGVDDATVAAVGRVTEALEWVERARGRLYDFHQLIGRAHDVLSDAADALDAVGHTGEAERLREDVMGRNVIQGRWTFQLVEEFDDGYWEAFRDAEQALRDTLLGGRRHVYEAELKASRLRWGRAHHDWSPGEG
jgi:hypothetical protein